MSLSSTAYAIAFQISPIWLTGGLFAQVPALSTTGYPIVGLTQTIAGGANLLQGQLPTDASDLSSYFCNYRPLPGSTLIKNKVAEYPFFTNQIAANAQLQEPLNISLLMYCPANSQTGVLSKLSVMEALQFTLQKHMNLGGTFTVTTPASTYTGCLLSGITDVSTGETNQPQWAYQWDFVKPLTAFPELNPTNLNSLMASIDVGGVLTRINGAISTTIR